MASETITRNDLKAILDEVLPPQTNMGVIEGAAITNGYRIKLTSNDGVYTVQFDVLTSNGRFFLIVKKNGTDVYNHYFTPTA